MELMLPQDAPHDFRRRTLGVSRYRKRERRRSGRWRQSAGRRC